MQSHPATASHHKSLLTALTTAALIATATSTADSQTQTLYVDDDAPIGGNGTTWNTAFRDLQDALDHISYFAIQDNEVRIAQGTYFPPQSPLGWRSFVMYPYWGARSSEPVQLDPAVFEPSHSRSVRDHSQGQQTVQVSSGITIRILGGYAGVNAAVPDHRDPAAFISVLSGDAAGNDTDNPASFTDNSPQILRCIAGTARYEFSGLTFAHAASTSTTPLVAGLLVVNEYSLDNVSILLQDCQFTRMYSKSSGAGAYIGIAGAIVSRCTFADMSLAPDAPGPVTTGGLIISTFGYTLTNPIVQDCTFRNIRGQSGAGLAARNNFGTVLVSRCNFENNSAVTGAAISTDYYDGRALATDCTFTANTAANGGALYGDVSATDSIFRSNTAENGGAAHGVFNTQFRNCLFELNTATTEGGALFQGATVVEDCRFIENTAAFGGAVARCSEASINRTTFTDNQATRSGGAVYAPQQAVYVYACDFETNRVHNPTPDASDQPLGGAMRVATAIIADTRFIGNTALSDNSTAAGGALFVSSFLELSDSIFSGNTVSAAGPADGGAIAAGGRVTINNSTFSRNDASSTSLDATGGAITFFAHASLNSSILWNNSVNGSMSAPTAQFNTLTPFLPLAARHNIITGLPEPFDPDANSGADPLFTDPDGPDDLIGTIDDDLRIRSVLSPAVDASDPVRSWYAFDLDADHAPREVDAPVVSPPSGPQVKADRGALEFQGNPDCAPFDIDLSGTVDTADLATFLAKFGDSIAPGSWPDFNVDGIVDTRDLVRFLSHFGCSRWS